MVLFFCFCPAGNLSRVMYPSFYGFSSPSCMAVVGSHFWFGRRFGSSLCCDASCLAVFIFLAGPCHWSSRVFMLRPSVALSCGITPLVSIWDALFCMAVVGSHLWFVRCFSSSLCCDASGFCCFVPATSFDASIPPSMI